VDLRTLLRAVRLHKVIFALVVAVGIAAGVAYAFLRPPLQVSSESVVVANTKSITIQGQAFIASSQKVLVATRKLLDHPPPLETLLNRVQVSGVTDNVIKISAEAKTAEEAQELAHAVARAFQKLLPTLSGPGAKAKPQLLGVAPPTGATLRTAAIERGIFGGLIGALIGVIIVVAIGRSDRRLRERDEIAGAIGIPVLASIPVVHPTDTAGWTRLLGEYEPAVVHAWNLRKVLMHIGVSDVRYGGPGVSVTVVSLSSDRRALAVGPQLAAFAASLGIPTVLSVGTQQDRNATATLSAACTMAAASMSRETGGLQFSVGDFFAGRDSSAALTVAVVVLDSKNPELPAMVRTTTTVIAVTSGAASAEQLARAAVSVTADGRDIAGILVADPDSSDRTTGRLPQLAELPRRRQSAQHRQQGQQRPTQLRQARPPDDGTTERRT
jgi:capsular polysaccharide biosynthesis protein